MGSSGEVGMPSAFASSLASQIESELNSILAGEGRDAFETNDNSSDARDRRMLFVAIAQGVVKHLVANPEAFRLVLTKDLQGRVTDAHIAIDSE
jgi:hypothetical protein